MNSFVADPFEEIAEIRRIVDQILQLSYAQILYPDDEIVEEIHELRKEAVQRTDRLEYRLLESQTKDESLSHLSTNEKIFIMRFSRIVMELVDISSDLVKSGMDLEKNEKNRVLDVITEGNIDSDVTIRKIVVRETSPINNITFSDGLFEHGIKCLFVKSEKGYDFDPEGEDMILSGMVLMVQGTKHTINRILNH